jgi:hypothetical protein
VLHFAVQNANTGCKSIVATTPFSFFIEKKKYRFSLSMLSKEDYGEATINRSKSADFTKKMHLLLTINH